VRSSSQEVGFSQSELRSLYLLFMPFGIAIMSAAPRFPDFESQLHLNNGLFGTFVSLGAIGSFLALTSIARYVHYHGVKRALILASFFMYGGLAISPHLHTGWIWLIDNIFIAFGASAYHVSINTQAFARQKQAGGNFLPKLHGSWSFGALFAAVLAFAITQSVSLCWHLTTLALAMACVTAIGAYRIRHLLVKGVAKEEGVKDEVPSFTLKGLMAMLKYEPLLNLAMLLGIQLELATNDWSTIYSHKNLGISESLSILPYILFLVTLILMRFFFPKFFLVMSEKSMIKIFPSLGGGFFLIFLLAGHFVGSNHRVVAFTLTNFAFIFAGAGCCFMSPLFFTIAARRAQIPSSLVIASLGVVNTILIFLVKLVIAWSAQNIGLVYALMIPGVMLVFTFVGSNMALNRKASEI